jgi:hypothetical protein
MTYTIHASKNDQTSVTVRINPATAVDKVRVLELLGWQVHVTDSSGHLFTPLELRSAFIACLRDSVAYPTEALCYLDGSDRKTLVIGAD